MPNTASATPTFVGDLHERGTPGYEEARRAAVWNGRKPDRFPDRILVAADERDVVAGVRYARDHGLRIGIRSGGHSCAATGVRDGGLLIDLSRLTDIDVDAAGRTAWVGPGVRGDQLGRRLAVDGLSFPYGGSPTVGLGGYLLTGGYGLNGKTLGSGAGNITAIDVVTADGELVRADADTNRDYLWAARGGGYGFFGAVVRFRIQLHAAPRYLTKGQYTFSVEDFEEFATWFFANLETFDSRLMTLVFGLRPPGRARGVLNLVALGFADTEDEVRELFRPLEEAPLLDRVVAREAPAPATYEEIWAATDRLYPEGARYLSDTVWIRRPDDPEFIAAYQHAFETLPPGGSHIMMNPWVPEQDDFALSGTTTLPVHLYGVGNSPAEDDLLQDWISSNMARIAPFSNGVGKVNESDLLRRDQHVLAPENEVRLEELRRTHDPHGRFHSFLRAPDHPDRPAGARSGGEAATGPGRTS